MDNNNSTPSFPKTEPGMDTGDWGNQLPQQLLSQQNSLHQESLGTQSNVAGLQQPQQSQLYQSQRTLPEMPSSSLDSMAQTESANGVDWQEEAYQKIRVMNEKYLSDLHDIYERVSANLEQQYSLPQQQRVKDFEKMKLFKTMLGRMIRFLLLSKSNIMPAIKDKLATYETQIINFLNLHRPRKPAQQGQLPQPHMQPMQQQSSQNGNLAINIVDWRTQHPPASRQKNVNTLMETLKKQVPYSGQEGIAELMRIAISFEELIFNTTRNQVDYLSKISLKMQSMEEGNQVKQEEFSKRFKTF